MSDKKSFPLPSDLKVVPGTEMGFPGIADAAKRQALIDWLRRE